MKIAIFAAFPQELKQIRKNSSLLATQGALRYRISLTRHCACRLIAVETGMGTAALESAFNHVLNTYRPDLVISLGFGGALYYRAEIGELVFASRYFLLTREGAVELQQLAAAKAAMKLPAANAARLSGLEQRIRSLTGNFEESLSGLRSCRAMTSESIMAGLRRKLSIREGSIITISEWMAKSKLKACLPENVNFPVCDRETVHLAKMSCRSNLPFLAVRSITDRLDEDIPEEFFQVIDENGNYRVTRALGVLLSRPSLIMQGLRLGRHAARASERLWEAVKAVTEVLSDAARLPVSDKPVQPGRVHRISSIIKSDRG